jgi:hypothetical protein
MLKNVLGKLIMKMDSIGLVYDQIGDFKFPLQ